MKTIPWYMLVPAYILITLQSIHDVDAAVLKQPVLLESARAFFNRTPPGTVAFLPGAINREQAIATWRFETLGENGAYQFRKQQRCWFMINHRDTDRTQGLPTYVAIQLVLFRSYPLVEPLTISRNIGWIRDDGSIAEEESISKDMNKDIEEFFILHRQDDMTLLDSYLGVLWHGRVSNSIFNSWDKKFYWERNIEEFKSSAFRNKFVPSIPESYEFSYQSYLIRFRVTHRARSERPIIFRVNCQNADYVWVKTFSPDAESYLHEYYLSFR